MAGKERPLASNLPGRSQLPRYGMEDGIGLQGANCRRADCFFPAVIAVFRTQRRLFQQVSGRLFFFCLAVPLFSSGTVIAQEMYKYQDESGIWVYTDRPPEGQQPVETRELPGGPEAPTVTVTTSLFDRRIS